MAQTQHHTQPHQRAQRRSWLLGLGLAGALMLGGSLLSTTPAEASGSNLKVVRRIKQVQQKIEKKAQRRAQRRPQVHQTPELDPSMAGQAAVLLLGGLLLLERKRKLQS